MNVSIRKASGHSDVIAVVEAGAAKKVDGPSDTSVQQEKEL